MGDEQKALLFVLRILLDEGEDWVRHKRPVAATMAAKSAESKFDAIDKQELEARFLYRGNQGRFDDNKIIWIKPPAKDPSAVAALWCRWNFEKVLPKCGFYYGLWSAQQAFPMVDPQDRTKHPAFVGYRYETPEQGDNHNFYHAQPCRSLGDKDEPIEDGLPISERDPTWPLAAANEVELLLCLVMSLYGRNGLSELNDKINGDVALRRNRSLTLAVNKLLDLKWTAD